MGEHESDSAEPEPERGHIGTGEWELPEGHSLGVYWACDPDTKLLAPTYYEYRDSAQGKQIGDGDPRVPDDSLPGEVRALLDRIVAAVK